jgi:hypothetical protein
VGNARVPRANTREVERVHGIDDDRNVVTLVVFEHVRAGHAAPGFYVVQYRERSRRTDRAPRVTRQYSGPRAAERLEADMHTPRELLAESRAREAARVTRARREQAAPEP